MTRGVGESGESYSRKVARQRQATAGADVGLFPEFEGQALARDHDAGGLAFGLYVALAGLADQVEGAVAALGVVVEERELRGLGQHAESQDFRDDRMTPAELARH